MAEIELAKMVDLDELSDKITDIETNVGAVSSAVEGKADSNHTHDYSEITGTPTIPNVDGFATVEEVESGLSSKSDEGHTHSYNDIEGTPTIPSIDGLVTQETFDQAISSLETVIEDLQDAIDALQGEDEG